MEGNRKLNESNPWSHPAVCACLCVCVRTLTWVWDERVLCLVAGRFRQQHRPSPTGHASRPQDQHALQQQQCMLGNRASHGGPGLGSLLLRPQGPRALEGHTWKDRKRQIWVQTERYFTLILIQGLKSLIQNSTSLQPPRIHSGRWKAAKINPYKEGTRREE